MAQLEVRTATLEDEAMLLEQSKNMIAESPRFSQYDFDDEKATVMALEVVGSGGWFVAENNGEFAGMVCGVVRDHWFGSGKTGHDLFVYVAPEHRGTIALWLLVQEFEKWCWDQGADDIDLGSITEVEPEKTIKAYAKLGYKLTAYACNKRRN